MTSQKLLDEARKFRKAWSHPPTAIPQNASGLWYSEECTDQLCAEFAASCLAEKEKELAEAKARIDEWERYHDKMVKEFNGTLADLNKQLEVARGIDGRDGSDVSEQAAVRDGGSLPRIVPQESRQAVPVDCIPLPKLQAVAQNQVDSPPSEGNYSTEAQGLDEGTCRYIDSLNRKIESAEALQATLKAREQEIERLKAENKVLDERHVTFIVQGGAVVMKAEYDKLKGEREIAQQLYAALEIKLESAERELAELKGKR